MKTNQFRRVCDWIRARRSFTRKQFGRRFGYGLTTPNVYLAALKKAGLVENPARGVWVRTCSKRRLDKLTITYVKANDMTDRDPKRTE